MINELTAEDKDEIMRSLTSVGISKAVGYLPLNTIINVLGYNVDILKSHFISSGLEVNIMNENECCIYSGAFFVYDEIMVRFIATEHSLLLKQMNFNSDPIEIIRLISSFWYEIDDPIMQLIDKLYSNK